MGEHSINSARTLYSGRKPNKTPLALAGHVEGTENNAREAAPWARGEGSAGLGGGVVGHRPEAAALGPYFLSRGCVPTREG